MHWGTFILTDEAIEEPRAVLLQELEKRNLTNDFLVAPTPGAIIPLKN
jgi:hypothetical protein